jgi:hypothetical protein
MDIEAFRALSQHEVEFADRYSAISGTGGIKNYETLMLFKMAFRSNLCDANSYPQKIEELCFLRDIMENHNKGISWYCRLIPESANAGLGLVSNHREVDPDFADNARALLIELTKEEKDRDHKLVKQCSIVHFGIYVSDWSKRYYKIKCLAGSGGLDDCHGTTVVYYDISTPERTHTIHYSKWYKLMSPEYPEYGISLLF